MKALMFGFTTTLLLATSAFPSNALERAEDNAPQAEVEIKYTQVCVDGVCVEFINTPAPSVQKVRECREDARHTMALDPERGMKMWAKCLTKYLEKFKNIRILPASEPVSK